MEMKKNIYAKAKKELEHRFGKQDLSNDGYCDHLDFRLIEDFTDEAFSFFMENVKGVNMLDLNETDVTNDSITLLTHLEYVNELRAKQCRNLDNECIDDLNKLTSLEFLYVKNTDITVDGLLRLNKLSQLRTLMFSADDVEAIKEKLVQLKSMLLHCELVIDSKPYYVNAIELFIHSLKNKPFQYQLKLKNKSLEGMWSSWLGHAADGCIEAEVQGTYAYDEIEWIEILPAEKRLEAESDAATGLDHSAKLIELLDVLEFPYIMDNGIVSVYILNKEI